MKWQQVSGTAEQKVPFEVICLMEAVATGAYQKAYLVLEAFVARANAGKL